jgi:DDE superfamily endonuclease
MQRLLTTAKWDVDAVRNELLSCVTEWFGDPRSVVVVSQAAFAKRGRHSAGVQQQYNEDSQRVENCQLGLFLGYATPLGTTLVDRELYLPEEWRKDRERRSRAGIPELAFASRSDLAVRMLRRVMDSGLPMSWVTTSELADVGVVLHAWLTGQQVPHIVEVRPSAPLYYERGVRLVRATARDLQRQVPARRWQQIRYAQARWSRLLLRTDQASETSVWLIVRRMAGGAPGRPYVATGPSMATLPELARAASAAPGVKTAVARAKDRVGLDHYEARRYEAWYRHVTLALFADALLQAHTRAGSDGQHDQVTVQSAQGVRGRCLQTTTPIAI